MPNRKNIDKWSLGYWMLRNLITRPFYTHYYKKIEISNAENIPKKESVIIAPNHQNALMDALAFVMGLRAQTVFLARADMFKKEFVARILTFMKILPIFRIRDGVSSLQKNDEIFDITVNILRNKHNPLLLFPEGNHGEYRRLRPLVKGIFRIAFKAQSAFGDQPGVKIVPAGVDYTHYSKFRQKLFVNFGKPIEVCEYWKEYEENQAVAINKLRDRLAEEMRKLMIDIQSEEYYPLYMDLRTIYGGKMKEKLGLKSQTMAAGFKADKALISALDQCREKDPQKIEALNTEYLKYKELRNETKLRDWVPSKPKYSIFIQFLKVVFSLAGLPLVLLGLFNNWPQFFLAPKIRKNIKDTQFHSTAIWGAGMVAGLVYYTILIILGLIFLPIWWVKIAYALTLFISGAFVISYRNFLVKAFAKIRYSVQVRKSGSKYNLLKQKYDTLVKLTDEIVNAYQ